MPRNLKYLWFELLPIRGLKLKQLLAAEILRQKGASSAPKIIFYGHSRTSSHFLASFQEWIRNQGCLQRRF